MASLGDLFTEFEKWLKKEKGMHSKQGISKKRRKIIEVASKVTHEVIKQHQTAIKDPLELAELCKQRYEGLEKEDKKGLDFFIDYLTNIETLGAIQKEGEIEAEEEIVRKEETEETISKIIDSDERKIIGRVSLTIKSPAKPTEFYFWSEDKPDLHIEIGSIVTVKGSLTSNGVRLRIIGIVTDMYATSATESPIDDFYSTGYGDATVEPPTARPVVRVVNVSIVYRDDGRFEPPLGNWPVYFANYDEIILAYNADVPEEYRVLSGFTWDDTKTPVPIYLDSRFLLGYEGAHVNISGASGLATKTSYALFLLQAVISRTTASEEPNDVKNKTAAILFNVKEADLMRIDDGPEDWDSLEAELAEDERDITAKLWNACKEEDLDPFSFRPRLKFFAPPRPNEAKKPLTFRSGEKKTTIFSYGLEDLTQSEGLALSSLLNPEDLDEKSLGLISSIYDDLRNGGIALSPRPTNFKSFLTALTKLRPDKGGWLSIGYGTHHSATLNKVQSRLSQAINHQLKGLLLQNDGSGKPVPIEKLNAGDVWVIDISKLHAKGQRLVFTHIYETINMLLEAKRNKETSITLRSKEIDLEPFPERVMVFVDELNKFAPSGKSASALKFSIVDITARGRSIGLSIVGAEQVANQVDEEILSNTSTFIVGRSHALSLKGENFHWLQGGLRDRAMVLEKGDMILWHAVHSRPVMISFPKPLHALGDK